MGIRYEARQHDTSPLCLNELDEVQLFRVQTRRSAFIAISSDARIDATREGHRMDSAESDRRVIAETTRTLLDAVNGSSVSRTLSVWADDGILMPPNHPSVVGREALEAYFRSLFARTTLQFEFTSSAIAVAGDVAIERVTYVATMRAVGAPSPIEDRGKGLHVYGRLSDGSWRLKQDIWNSDRPLVA